MQSGQVDAIASLLSSVLSDHSDPPTAEIPSNSPGSPICVSGLFAVVVELVGSVNESRVSRDGVVVESYSKVPLDRVDCCSLR